MKKIYLTLFLLLFSTSAFAFDVCEHEKKYSQIWYVNNCDGETLVIKKEKRKNRIRIHHGKVTKMVLHLKYLGMQIQIIRY